MVTVCAVLDPQELDRVEAAGVGHFETLPAGSLRQALRTVRRRPVVARTVRGRACGEGLAGVACFTTVSPAIPIVVGGAHRGGEVRGTLLRRGARGARRAAVCAPRAGGPRRGRGAARPASPAEA